MPGLLFVRERRLQAFLSACRFTREFYAATSSGGRNTHAATKDFGTKSSADLLNSNNSSSSDSIVLSQTSCIYIKHKIEACHLGMAHLGLHSDPGLQPGPQLYCHRWTTVKCYRLSSGKTATTLV
jgi:hypothetical protein